MCNQISWQVELAVTAGPLERIVEHRATRRPGQKSHLRYPHYVSAFITFAPESAKAYSDKQFNICVKQTLA